MSRTKLKLKGLSLDRLETLSRIVSRGSIAQASGGNPNKQSQFSRQLAELEGWFGIELLDRSSVPNKPTVAANRIVGLVDAFMQEIEQVRESAQSGRRTVIFGAGERMIRGYLIPWAARAKTEGVKLVFRNLESRTVRRELLAKRVDIGLLRKDQCPVGMAHHPLRPIPMCLFLPERIATSKRRWKWDDLRELPIVILGGGNSLAQVIETKESDLNIAMECSTWTQVLDGMRACGHGGFVPQDLEHLVPEGYRRVPLAGLSEHFDEYVIAWNEAAVRKDPFLKSVLTRLGAGVRNDNLGL